MIDLKTTKTHTLADNDTIKSILGDAFEQTIDVFVAIVRLRKTFQKKNTVTVHRFSLTVLNVY